MIYEWRSDETFGDMVIVRPDKVDKTIEKNPRTRAWYELQINLAEDGIIGPFDFEPNHRIGDIIWSNLTTEAELHDIDTSDLDKIIPLG